MAIEPQQSAKRRSLVPRNSSQVGLVVVVIVATVFAVLNLSSVKVDWIFGSGHAPLIIVIAVSLLLGAAAGRWGDRLGTRRKTKTK